MLPWALHVSSCQTTLSAILTCNAEDPAYPSIDGCNRHIDNTSPWPCFPNKVTPCQVHVTVKLAED